MKSNNRRTTDSSHSAITGVLDLPSLVLTEDVLLPTQTMPVLAATGAVGRLAKGARVAVVIAKGKSQLKGTTALQEANSSFRFEELEKFVCIARVEGQLDSPGGAGVVLQGLQRARLLKWTQRVRRGDCLPIATVVPVKLTDSRLPLTRAQGRRILALVRKLFEHDDSINDDAREWILSAREPIKTADLAAPYLSLTKAEKVQHLGFRTAAVLHKTMVMQLQREFELKSLSDELNSQLDDDMMDEQRRLYITEQIRMLKSELAEIDGEESVTSTEKMEEDLQKLELAGVARSVVREELERLHSAPFGTPEYMIAQSYLNFFKELPWNSACPKLPSFAFAEKTMAKSHFGLETVKQAVLEHLATIHYQAQRGRMGSGHGQMLLLLGPPGVGKTTLAASLAKALGRPFTRISLGSMRDEAELRGHRRTYVGAMAGSVLTALRRVGSKYPVILLDEIDKLGVEKGNDPTGVLLEILDEQQNKEFTDHYLGIPFDLSKVIFVATANDAESIAQPLIDRMQVIRLSSYTEEEKTVIAMKHLVPAIRKKLGVERKDFQPTKKLVQHLVRFYTSEAGVRQLERLLATLAKKVIMALVKGEDKPELSVAKVAGLIGQIRYLPEPNDATLPPGVAVGLAYTDVGGDILYIEVGISPHCHQFQLKLTGSLGRVMRESAQAAVTYIIDHQSELDVHHIDWQSTQIHVHFPDGATPKDGPSAGVAVLLAILSKLKGISLSSNFAATGEISLRGRVLAVGGLKEKLVAAKKMGKSTVVVPLAAKSECLEVSESIRADLDIHYVENVAEAIAIAKLDRGSGTPIH